MAEIFGNVLESRRQVCYDSYISSNSFQYWIKLFEVIEDYGTYWPTQQFLVSCKTCLYLVQITSYDDSGIRIIDIFNSGTNLELGFTPAGTYSNNFCLWLKGSRTFKFSIRSLNYDDTDRFKSYTYDNDCVSTSPTGYTKCTNISKLL